MGQTSFLAALCLLLSSVEYAIPKPLPFLRLGLANLPIILSLRKLSVRNVLLLTLLKIVGQAIISGTLFSYVFLLSASGSIASVCIMLFVFLLTEAVLQMRFFSLYSIVWSRFKG